MPKKKKTRKQKIIADTRRQVYLESPTPKVEIGKLPQIALRPKPVVKQTISLPEFSYLYTDLIKTAILTSSIVIAELLLKFIFSAQ